MNIVNKNKEENIKHEQDINKEITIKSPDDEPYNIEKEDIRKNIKSLSSRKSEKTNNKISFSITSNIKNKRKTKEYDRIPLCTGGAIPTPLNTNSLPSSKFPQ